MISYRYLKKVTKNYTYKKVTNQILIIFLKRAAIITCEKLLPWLESVEPDYKIVKSIKIVQFNLTCILVTRTNLSYDRNVP